MILLFYNKKQMLKMKIFARKKNKKKKVKITLNITIKKFHTFTDFRRFNLYIIIPIIMKIIYIKIMINTSKKIYNSVLSFLNKGIK